MSLKPATFPRAADTVRDPGAGDVPQAPPLDPRIIAWDRARLLDRRCPMCDASQCHPIVRRPDGLIVGRCDACGGYYLPQIPSNDALAEFYERYSVNHQSWQSAKKRAAALKAARRRRGGNGLLGEIGRRRPIAGQRLIEFGCSRGSFLLDSREAGASVSGMELDAGAREFLSHLSIPCHATMAAAAAAGPYDIVVALNVIEHLPQPKLWLEQISAMTAPGGLVVIWTPNGGQADTFGAGWVGFRVDLDHLSYFSAKNLSALLVDVGLWPEAVWELSQANLSGFRKTQSGPSRKDRLVQRLKGKPVLSWAVPPGVGGFSLGMFAGKA